MDKKEQISWLMNCYVGDLISGSSEKASLANTVKRHCEGEGFSKEILLEFLDEVLHHDSEEFWENLDRARSQ